ncbi:FAD/NAD-binding domain-containing protein [Sanghuangporus baumii]|uniref:FAD/NAD-binding domain-containing protein n=1 Tax=Sanghuangporus baumii TaxID=108892 RepID=A0A9Q5I604_SANBA|nr:FAD/NAD-binding domain-containing protein [Sanghuangporus baumii]
MSASQPEIALPTLTRLSAWLPKEINTSSVASEWFDQFAQHLEKGNVAGVAALLTSSGLRLLHVLLIGEDRSLPYGYLERAFIISKFSVSDLFRVMESACSLYKPRRTEGLPGASRSTSPNHGDDWLAERQREVSFEGSESIVVIHLVATIADWLEFYAQALDFNVRMGANVEKIEEGAVPGQDPWNVRVFRANGERRILKPRHVVLATSLYGSPPRKPNFPGVERFKGRLIHTTEYKTAREHEGKKIVVIGACTSGHDVCQEHVKRGINVTMVQRESTYIMNTKNGAGTLHKGPCNEEHLYISVKERP